MNKVLAIETSSDACSAALIVGECVNEIFEIAPQKHTQFILPMVNKLLADAKLKLSQLDAIAFGCGPGSFTGIRLAASIVQGLAFGANLPVVPISTLHAMAQAAFTELKAENVLVALDARMGEIYWGAYRLNDSRKFMEPMIKDRIGSAISVELPESYHQWIGVGSGWDIYGDILRERCKILNVKNGVYPRANEVAKLGVRGFLQGLAVSPQLALPVYLRDEVAKS